MADEEIKRLLDTLATQNARTHAQTRRQLAGTAAGLHRQAEESAAETRHYFDVVAEGLRSGVRTVAEGLVATNEKFDRRFDGLELKVDRNFAETLRFSHADLESRFPKLEREHEEPEEEVEDLQSRVQRLESTR